MADSDSGLQIIDISNPATPSLVGSYDTSGSALGVTINGNYAYVADSNSGLQIIDISNPAAPSLVGSYAACGWALGVTINGNYAYVADYESGLQIIDISNPAAPSLVGSYAACGWAHDVAINGNYAYVANHESGLKIIDISNPATPSLVGSYNTSWSTKGVTINGNYAYVANDYLGLQIIDISSPAAPLLVGSYNTAGWAHDVAINGNYAYVANGYSGLQIIDVSGFVLGTLNTAPTSSNITLTIDEDIAYILKSSDFKFSDIDVGNTLSKVKITALESAGALKLNGVDVTLNQEIIAADITSDKLIFTPASNASGSNATFGFKVSDGIDYSANSYTATINIIKNPTLVVGSYNTSGNARDVTINGNYAYVADGLSGLQIINISNPAAPSLVGSYDTSAYAFCITINGNYAYVADNDSGLQIIDISNPATPSLVGSYNTSGNARDVTINGNYAYVADGLSGLQIINISNPAAPSLVGSYDTSGWAEGVTINRNYAYVADGWSGLQIIDISNPTTPSLVGSYDTSGGANGVTINGNYAYVADGLSGLQIINISNPAAPSLVGSYGTVGNAYDVTINGNYAYVADYELGLQIINISNPAAPSLVGSYGTVGSAYDVTINGNYAYVANDESGLQIIDVSDFVLGTPTNKAPTSSNTTLTATEDTALTLTTANFNFTDSDVGSALSKVQITALESAGALKLNGVDVTLNQEIIAADITAGKLVFTPASNASGSSYATFGFKVSDGTDYSANSYTATINVISDTSDDTLSKQQITSLVYESLLGRIPETEGMNYWVDTWPGGASWQVDLANTISTTPESKALYSLDMNDLDFVKAMYVNLFSMSSVDQSALDYWTNWLDTKENTPGEFRGEMINTMVFATYAQGSGATYNALMAKADFGVWAEEQAIVNSRAASDALSNLLFGITDSASLALAKASALVSNPAAIDSASFEQATLLGLSGAQGIQQGEFVL